MSDIQIVVTESCNCPICGATEVVDDTVPVLERRINVRAYKVCDDDGLWWSECLLCRETDGNGWFATTEEGDTMIEPSRIAAIEARGEEVERIER